MEWRNQTVLVTGAGGFIGSHLTERLVALGARTRALVRYNSGNSWGCLDESPIREDIEVILGDIRDPDSLRGAVRGTDVIFHLAALIGIPYSFTAPLSYVRTNVEGTANLLQAAMDGGVKLLVHTSTSEVYGTARYVPIDENHPLRAQSPYSASKIGADKLVESYHLSFGLPTAVLRPFNTYGPRQSARAVIPTIISQALTQREVLLGNLRPTRDFTYVGDTVEGFIRIAECPQAIGGVIHIGTGEEISIGDLARTVLNVVSRDIPIIGKDQRVRPEKSEVDRLCADSSQAQKLLSWRPNWTLQEGLVQAIEWVERNLERYRPSIYAT